MPSSHPAIAQPLAGATVIVTRPAGTSASLRASARMRGAQALALPGLSLRGSTQPDVGDALVEAARAAQAWIFTSPNAVRFAFAVAPGLRLPVSARVLGVGRGTQRALARRGVAAVVPVERSDSEGLLALPELAEVRGWRVALVGAPGGRDLIAATLRQRGATVEPLHVYERRAPRLGRRHFDALAQASAPWLTLLSSAAALANLVALLPPALLARLRHQPFVVSSPRLAAQARAQGFEDVVEAASALPRDLLAAAARALARHRL